MIEDNGRDASGFADLALAPELCHVLSDLGYEEPTPIQAAAIPPLLAGRDLVGLAATGTGKTAAFALPLLQRLAGAGKRKARPSALLLVPTRELAIQVAEAIYRYGRALGISVLPIYGGQGFELPRIGQSAYLVPRSHKLAALARVLDVEAPAAALVFCRTRTEVDEVTRTLSARGYRPEALHGGMTQEQRDRVMRLFRAGTAEL